METNFKNNLDKLKSGTMNQQQRGSSIRKKSGKKKDKGASKDDHKHDHSKSKDASKAENIRYKF